MGRKKFGPVNGTHRPWEIVGLTPQNTIAVEYPDRGVVDTNEPPSAWFGLDYLTRKENAILRRGLTPSGKDRTTPKGETIEP